mgnify:FL=1
MSAGNSLAVYSLSVKVGASHVGPQGITVELRVANSHPGNKTIIIILEKELATAASGSIGIVSKTVTLYGSTIPDTMSTQA